MMSKIVRAVTKPLYPFIIIFGAYLVVHGHLTPGGGFQGGAVVASAIALVVVAYGGTGLYRKGSLTSLEAAGLITFISLAVIGMATVFFYNFLANGGLTLGFGRGGGISIFGESVAYGPNPGYFNTGGVIPLMNMAVGLEVVGGLGVILIAMGKRAFEVRK